MNIKRELSGTTYFHKRISIIFVFLVFGMAALMTLYWTLVLEPQLISRAKTTARSVVKANILNISELLESFNNPHDRSLQRMKLSPPGSNDLDLPTKKQINRQIDKISNILEHILLLEDSESGLAYIKKISMDVDFDALNYKNNVTIQQ